MIVGHGIDIESIQSIEEAYQRHPRFASKVLTETERARFDQLSGKRKMEYLAGRWSAKEAFSLLFIFLKFKRSFNYSITIPILQEIPSLGKRIFATFFVINSCPHSGLYFSCFSTN